MVILFAIPFQLNGQDIFAYTLSSLAKQVSKLEMIVKNHEAHLQRRVARTLANQVKYDKVARSKKVEGVAQVVITFPSDHSSFEYTVSSHSPALDRSITKVLKKLSIKDLVPKVYLGRNTVIANIRFALEE